MGKVSLILPVYNGEKYLPELVDRIRNQRIPHEIEIIAAVSKSNDNSLSIANDLCDITFLVKDFNHAKTRHEAALKANGEILVFITQDVLPYDNLWLNNLVNPLLEKNNDIVASYSRQIAYPTASEIEKLIREFNYPEFERVCNKETKETWGRKNIFYSDASSATLKNIFLELGGYNFEIGTNEDVIYALNVIQSGKSVLYNPNSRVYHSHDFEFKSAFNRYKLIGEFEKKYQDRLVEYSSMGEGKKLLIYLLRRLIKKLKIKDLFLLVIDIFTRFIAYRIGFSKN